MAHKGLREWTGEEAGNLFLGQNGFHVLKGTGAITAVSKGITYWIAFKAVDGNAGFKAQAYGAGDDFTLDGVYATGAEITIADGDIVYGSFDSITIGSATEYIIAYIGK